VSLPPDLLALGAVHDGLAECGKLDEHRPREFGDQILRRASEDLLLRHLIDGALQLIEERLPELRRGPR